MHLLAAMLGPALAAILLGSVTLGVVWRTSALTVAFSLVVAGLSIVAMAVRAEWRREPVEGRRTGRALLRLAVAFVLVVLATS